MVAPRLPLAQSATSLAFDQHTVERSTEHTQVRLSHSEFFYRILHGAPVEGVFYTHGQP
jgi:hypothetical protein